MIKCYYYCNNIRIVCLFVCGISLTSDQVELKSDKIENSADVGMYRPCTRHGHVATFW